MTLAALAASQVIMPDPSVRGLYEAAFLRHVNAGNTLFAHLHQ